MGFTLFHQGQTRLEVATRASKDTVSLLKDTTWGSPGKTQYKHLESEAKIKRMSDAHFISLRRFRRLLGNVTFCHRPLYNAGWQCQGSFIRYFSLQPALEHVTHPLLPKQQMTVRSNWAIGNSLLKSAVGEFMRSEIAGSKKSLIYAYIESDNTLSERMSQSFGFISIGSFETLIFNRFKPKSHPKVSAALPSETNTIKDMLSQQYETHNLYSSEQILRRGSFYVYKDKGEILACVQAFPIRWEICNMPGRTGDFLLKFLPKFPFSNRLIHPSQYQFAAFEGLCIIPGAEDILSRFFESVCAQLGVYSAMLWVDIHSPLAATIKTRCRLGVLNALNSAPPANIMVKGFNISPIELRSLKTNNTYISAWDIT